MTTASVSQPKSCTSSDVCALAEFILTAADCVPQGGTLLLHPSQQPLELIYTPVFLLAGFFCDPQLLLLIAQTLLQLAAFNLEETVTVYFCCLKCGFSINNINLGSVCVCYLQPLFFLLVLLFCFL